MEIAISLLSDLLELIYLNFYSLFMLAMSQAVLLNIFIIIFSQAYSSSLVFVILFY